MKLFVLIILSGLINIKVALGQAPGRQVEKAEEAWFQYYNTLNLSYKVSLKSDIGVREAFLMENLKQFLVRSGAYFQIHPQATVGLGAAYFLSEDKGVMRPELRPFQEIELKGTRLGRLDFTHRFRLEERFFRSVIREGISSGTNFNYRARYRVLLLIPLNQKEMQDRTFFLSFFDEVMLNFGNQIVSNVLNNNRLGAGLGYQVNEQLRVVPTYIFQIGQKASGNTFTHTHILWLTLNHTLKLTR
jgi:hypothetical protein